MSHSLQYIVDSTRVNIGTSCSRLDMHFHLTISHKVLRKTASLADDGKGSHEEGEHHRCLLDFLQSVQDGQANQVAQRCKGAHASLAASECTCTADSSWAPKWTTERCGPQDCCLSGRQCPCRRRCLEELLLERTSAQGPGRGPTQSWLSSQLKLTTNPLAVKRMQNKKEWTSGCQSDSSFSVTNLNLNEARWKTHASTKYQKVDQKVCGALLNHLHRHLQVRQVLLNLLQNCETLCLQQKLHWWSHMNHTFSDRTT